MPFEWTERKTRRGLLLLWGKKEKEAAGYAASFDSSEGMIKRAGGLGKG
jgi:hypothetical protein